MDERDVKPARGSGLAFLKRIERFVQAEAQVRPHLGNELVRLRLESSAKRHLGSPFRPQTLVSCLN